MASLNKVILVGNLTRDPDLRQTRNGMAICEFGIAVNRRWRDQGGRDQDDVLYIDVTVWNKAAEHCAQYLQKGSPVLVEGRLHFDQWEDRNGGGKRSRHSVVAETIQFLAGRSEGQPEDRQSKNGRANQGHVPYPVEDEPDMQEEEIPF